MKRTDRHKVKLWIFAAILSILTMAIFHRPFFSYILGNVEADLNGALITASLGVIMLAANFFVFYLVLWLGRIVGKVLAGLLFIGNAVALYFINTYDVIIDDSMMGNVFNTNTAEATSYWSSSALLYILLAGVLPAVIIFLTRLDYGSFKRFLANVGCGIGIVAAVAFANMSNWMWIDKNSTVMGSLILPWSYIVNTFRYQSAERERNRQEIPLPDASIRGEGKKIAVLVIGESARRDHFSLYGYERRTNPLLEDTENVRAFKANSAATYTTAGVKAILSYRDCDELYEILPNYLNRTGVDVIWRSSNWGEPPLHIEKVQKVHDIAKKSEGLNPDWDETLLYGLKEEIAACDSDRILVILHTSVSHGPSYAKKYPGEFERWTPVPHTVEMSKCPVSELVNAYDNGILYTDTLLHRIIEGLKGMEGWDSCMMYVSDHGESLGENGLYMHGVPLSIAPAEQYEIPFIVWTSEPAAYVDNELLTQYHVFHSMLHALDIDSPVYNRELDIFE
ncbi:MAG: phosphoethanolamine--lipid A transferase EptA [Bacteroidales bacterium]|nr:phosphoethanolamine--lipid A transferase EptA [Bacteroidales bacterium]